MRKCVYANVRSNRTRHILDSIGFQLKRMDETGSWVRQQDAKAIVLLNLYRAGSYSSGPELCKCYTETERAKGCLIFYTNKCACAKSVKTNTWKRGKLKWPMIGPFNRTAIRIANTAPSPFIRCKRTIQISEMD